MADKKIFTATELAQHTHKDSLYVAIHGKVYDCSGFIDEVTFFFPFMPFIRGERRSAFLKISLRMSEVWASFLTLGSTHG